MKQGNKKTIYLIIRFIVSLLLAAIFGGIIFSMAGFSAIEVYVYIIKAAFGSLTAILTTLHHATPLLFTGMAFMFAGKAGILNLGTEGQLYVGGMVAALVGAYLPQLPYPLEIPFIILCGCVASGLYAMIAAYLHVKFSANLVILTLMMNYVSQLFCSYLVSYPLKDEQGIARTKKIYDSAVLDRLIPSHYLSKAVLIAFFVVIFCYFFLKYAKFGYHMKAVGLNKAASISAGIKTKNVILISMFISGAIAGLCGVTQVLGVQYRFMADFSSGFGFQGIAVAALAYNNPLALFFSAILWGGIKAGASEVNRIASVPMDVIMNIQALVVIFVAAPNLLDFILTPVRKILLKGEKV